MATVSQVKTTGVTFRRSSRTLILLLHVFVGFLCCDFVSMDKCVGHFDRCVCNSEEVICHDQKNLTDIHILYSYIADTVQKVIITGSHFHEIPPNLLRRCQHSSQVLNDLKVLDISNNSIRQIHGKSFHCMPGLENLTLAHNEWMIDFHGDQTGYFTSLPALKHLDLTNSFDEVWNGTIHIPKLASVFNHTDMTRLESLKLGHNELMSFSISAANSLCTLTSLKTLDLSHNKLSIPALPTIIDGKCLEKLEVLDLSYNKMPRLPKEFMTKLDTLSENIQHIKLGHNDYMCDCTLIETYNWLKESRLPLEDLDDVRCTDGYHSSYINKTVLELKAEDLQCLQFQPPNNVAVKAVTGIIFSVIAIVLIAFVIVQRDRLRKVASSCTKKIPSVNLRPHSGYKSVQEEAVHV